MDYLNNYLESLKGKFKIGTHPMIPGATLIYTPFTLSEGQNLVVAVYKKKESVVLTDCAETIPSLEANKINLDNKESRAYQKFNEYMNEAGFEKKYGKVICYEIPNNQIGEGLFRFIESVRNIDSIVMMVHANESGISYSDRLEITLKKNKIAFRKRIFVNGYSGVKVSFDYLIADKFLAKIMNSKSYYKAQLFDIIDAKRVTTQYKFLAVLNKNINWTDKDKKHIKKYSNIYSDDLNDFSLNLFN